MTLPTKFIRQLLIWVVVGIALYTVAVVFTGLNEVRDSVAAVGVVGWLSLIGLSVINFAARFWRWQSYLHQLGHDVPPGPSLCYFLGGFAFTTTPAKAGEVVRSIYLKRHGVSYTDSFAALFVERLMDVIAIVLLAMLVAYSIDGARWSVVAVGVATLACLPLIHSRRLQAFLDRKRLTIKSSRIRSSVGHFANLLRSSAVLLRSRSLYGGLAAGLIAAGAVALTLYLILGYLGADVSASLAVGIYSVSILIGASTFLPGGLGSTEASMIGLLVLAGVDQTVAVSAALICRVATLWFAVLVGVVVIICLESVQERRERARVAEA